MRDLLSDRFMIFNVKNLHAIRMIKDVCKLVYFRLESPISYFSTHSAAVNICVLFSKVATQQKCFMGGRMQATYVAESKTVTKFGNYFWLSPFMYQRVLLAYIVLIVE